ncbi:unnamed protein product [Microthlaspi erraticum]|uniref:Semialdehyde dehydrogenase NAD-binding domain-containing protein n=1 Tax=Microthlaspi erraticum TaxID=1685480 RepID=A0A6D2JP55_9BRAS|nr:unnamed protein product [Microthlaspi erraticum]
MWQAQVGESTLPEAAKTVSSGQGERKIHVADKRAKRLALGSSNVPSPSSMSFRVLAGSFAKPEKDIRIGLVGAEIVRLLANHPHFGVTLMTAYRKAGQSMESVFPHLKGQFDLSEGCILFYCGCCILLFASRNNPGRGAKEANLYSEIAEGISSYGVTRIAMFLKLNKDYLMLPDQK